MAEIYKISARILPYKLPAPQTLSDDARLSERKLVVPMRGEQTIGELFLKIERIYNEVYVKVPPLRINTLATEHGEAVHTQFLVSDVFEKRSSTTDSSQWTVVVERQSPAAEEIEEFNRAVRPFSIGPLSYARPQGEFPVGAIELSANTPVKRVAFRPQSAEQNLEDVIIPSTERDASHPPGLRNSFQAQNPVSHTLIPNSQQVQMEDHTVVGDPIVPPSAIPSVNKPQSKRKAPAKKQTGKKPQLREAESDLQDKPEMPPTKRRRTNVHDRTPENPTIVEPEPESSEQAEIGKEHPTQPALGSKSTSPERRASNERQSQERAARADKIRVSLNEMNADLEKAGIQGTPKRTKLTPLIPGSSSKRSVSTASAATEDATSKGLDLLRTPSLSPLAARKTTSQFAPGRFRATDAMTLSKLAEEQKASELRRQKEIESDKAQLESLLNDNETDVDIENHGEETNLLPVDSSKLQSSHPQKAQSTSKSGSDEDGSIIDASNSPDTSVQDLGTIEQASGKPVQKGGRGAKAGTETMPPKAKAEVKPGAKRRGRPPGSKNVKSKLDKESDGSDGKTTKAKATKAQKPKQIEESLPNNDGAQQNPPAKGKRGRKPKSEEEKAATRTAKKEKPVSPSAEPSNTHAMDGSEDKPAVIAATSRAYSVEDSPVETLRPVVETRNLVDNQRSYSRSPAKEVDTSSDETSESGSTTSDEGDTTTSEPAQRRSNGDRTTEEWDTDTDASKEKQNLKAQMNTVKPVIAKSVSAAASHKPKRKLELDPTESEISTDSDADEPQLPPPFKKNRPDSSTQQASAQLQSEATASLKSAPTVIASSQNGTNRLQKSTSRVQYDTLSGLKQLAAQKNLPVYKEPSKIQMKQIAASRLNGPANQPTAFSDDSSDDSSDSDDSDLAVPQVNGTGVSGLAQKTSKGFRGLLSYGRNKT